jgi:hypothetical protein
VLRTPNLVQVEEDLVVMGMLADRRDELGRLAVRTARRPRASGRTPPAERHRLVQGREEHLVAVRGAQPAQPGQLQPQRSRPRRRQ